MTEEAKLGNFFALMAEMGLGVHPDLGHNDELADLRAKAYAPERPTEEDLAYNSDWQPL